MRQRNRYVLLLSEQNLSAKCDWIKAELVCVNAHLNTVKGNVFISTTEGWMEVLLSQIFHIFAPMTWFAASVVVCKWETCLTSSLSRLQP